MVRELTLNREKQPHIRRARRRHTGVAIAAIAELFIHPAGIGDVIPELERGNFPQLLPLHKLVEMNLVRNFLCPADAPARVSIARIQKRAVALEPDAGVMKRDATEVEIGVRPWEINALRGQVTVSTRFARMRPAFRLAVDLFRLHRLPFILRNRQVRVPNLRGDEQIGRFDVRRRGRSRKTPRCEREQKENTSHRSAPLWGNTHESPARFTKNGFYQTFAGAGLRYDATGSFGRLFSAETTIPALISAPSRVVWTRLSANSAVTAGWPMGS